MPFPVVEQHKHKRCQTTFLTSIFLENVQQKCGSIKVQRKSCLFCRLAFLFNKVNRKIFESHEDFPTNI